MRGKRAKTLLVILSLVVAILSTMTRPAYAQSRSMGSNLLKVGDSTVKRIMPVPESDSTYADADYTEVHFRQNKADLDLDYMDNGKSLQHLHRVFDSLGIENVAAVEIIAQSSPDGGLARNEWLTEHRSQVILEYMNLHFPELSDRISLNTVTESWENLSMYVAQDPNLTEKNRTKILDIIDSPTMSVATKKSRLKNNLGSQSKLGNLYSYLLKYYYPVIRNTGIYVLHTVEPVTAFNMPPLVPYVEETSPVLPDTIGPAPAQSEPHVFEEPDSTPPERKRPVLAFGNSSGDYSMVNYAEGNPDHTGMGCFIVCDDTEREYGSAEKATDFYEEARAKLLEDVCEADAQRVREATNKTNLIQLAEQEENLALTFSKEKNGIARPYSLQTIKTMESDHHHVLIGVRQE